MKKIIYLLSILILTALPVYAKDGRVNPNKNQSRGQVNTHVGQMDTDGRLSPGELRNPAINYNAPSNIPSYNRPIYNPPSYYRPGYYNNYARDRYYDQRLRELDARERELAYQAELARRYENTRYDRSWWDW